VGNNNKKKADQLGMPIGTASGRLRKLLVFHMSVKLGENVCYRCGEKICGADDLSIDHIVDWLDSTDPSGLFFDVENLAFSHLVCNISSGRRKKSDHGSLWKYKKHGCRCDLCREANAEKSRRDRLVLCPSS